MKDIKYIRMYNVGKYQDIMEYFLFIDGDKYLACDLHNYGWDHDWFPINEIKKKYNELKRVPREDVTYFIDEYFKEGISIIPSEFFRIFFFKYKELINMPKSEIIKKIFS